MAWLVLFNFAVQPSKVVYFKAATLEQCLAVAQMLLMEAQHFAACFAADGGI